jgi:hypothetical protein
LCKAEQKTMKYTNARAVFHLNNNASCWRLRIVIIITQADRRGATAAERYGGDVYSIDECTWPGAYQGARSENQAAANVRSRAVKHGELLYSSKKARLLIKSSLALNLVKCTNA